MVCKEAPRVSVVLFRENDAHTAAIRAVSYVSTIRHPMPPQHAEEQRASAAHDSDVWQDPVAVVVLDLVDNILEERVMGNGTHGIVGDSSGHSLAHPGRIREQRLKLTVAAIVQIEVDTAVVVQNEVSDGVGAFNRVRIVPERLFEPFVFLVDELQARIIGPQLVLPIRVQINA